MIINLMHLELGAGDGEVRVLRGVFAATLAPIILRLQRVCWKISATVQVKGTRFSGRKRWCS